MNLMDLIDGVGYVLDTPGAYTRGLIAGRPGERVAGRDLLERYGIVGANQEGLDAGDVGGFLAELLLDPTNLIGGGALKAVTGANKGIRAANASSKAMRAAGAMPEEIARLTKLRDINVPESLNPAEATAAGPLKMYHGTKRSGIEARDIDPRYAGSNTDSGFYSEGSYFSDDRNYADEYAKHRMYKPPESGAVIQAYLDVRNPFMTLGGGPVSFLDDIERKLGVRLHEAGDGLRPVEREIAKSRAVTNLLKERGYDGVVVGSDDLVGGVAPFAKEAAVFDNSQIFTPYIAPALQNEKSIAPYLAMLLGVNAGQFPYDLTAKPSPIGSASVL